MASSKLAPIMVVPYLLVVFMLLIGFGSSDINQDKAECQDQIVALATCLPYVGGDAKNPTLDCCSGLKQLLQKSKKCLCLLIKDKDDPSLGVKINGTLAANLPTACNAPANVTECISLLHLAPNSPEAKIFQGFANITQGHSSTSSANGNSTSSGSTAAQKSDGRRSGKRWLGLEMACGILVWIFFTLHLNSGI